MLRRIQKSWTLKFDGAGPVVINVNEFPNTQDREGAIRTALQLIKDKKLQSIEGSVIKEEDLEYAHYKERDLGAVFFMKPEKEQKK